MRHRERQGERENGPVRPGETVEIWEELPALTAALAEIVDPELWLHRRSRERRP